MSNTDFLGRAIDVVKKAIESDTAGDYEKAYQTYYQACEVYLDAETCGEPANGSAQWNCSCLR